MLVSLQFSMSVAITAQLSPLRRSRRTGRSSVQRERSDRPFDGVAVEVDATIVEEA
jgi:hypothetical protein